MQIYITARHFKASDQLKMFIDNKIQRLEKFYDGIIEANVIMDYVKATYSKHNAEIHLTVHGQILRAHEMSDDMYKSLDKALGKLERKLKKHKARVRNFNHKKAVELVLEDSQWKEEK